MEQGREEQKDEFESIRYKSLFDALLCISKIPNSRFVFGPNRVNLTNFGISLHS